MLNLKKEKEFNSLEVIKKAQDGDESALLKIIDDNKPLLNSVIKKFKINKIDLEDIYQCATLGLIKAIKNFDINSSNQFSTYAVILILGEIRKYYRDETLIHINRSIKETRKKIFELEKKYDKSLSINEISSLLNISKEEIIEALEANTICYSLDEPLSSDNDITYLDIISEEEEQFSYYDLKDEIDKLDKKDKLIIELRYYDGLSQSEVAKRLFMSQVTVSRKEKRILNMLKENIKIKSLHTKNGDD